MAGTQTKINNLQAVRAFAAFVVVVFHTSFVLPHLKAIGSFGVDVFFVLSGYIMARICETNPRFFLRRRIIRIVPPYWFFTFLLFLLAVVAPNLMKSTSSDVGELLKSLFFIPFVKGSGLIRPVLFVGWSLNYEMFFYVAIALGLWLAPKRPMLFASIVIVVAHCAAYALPTTAVSLFLMRQLILEFPLGVIVYYLARQAPEQAARRWRLPMLGLTATWMLGLMLLQGLSPFGKVSGFVCNALLCGLLVLSASLLSQGGWDTRQKWLILVGDASYILYLIHPYCEYAVQRAVVPHLPYLRIDRLPGCVVAVGFSIAMAIPLHLYAERPLVNYLNERFGGHRKSAEFRVAAEPAGQVNP